MICPRISGVPNILRVTNARIMLRQAEIAQHSSYHKTAKPIFFVEVRKRATSRHRPDIFMTSSTREVIETSRRSVLRDGLAVVIGSALFQAYPGRAAVLKSRASYSPSTLTIENAATNDSLQVYWLNYDGDAELFATIPPGGFYTIDTFETHPWRLVNARTGGVVKEIIASGTLSSIYVNDADFDSETTAVQKPSEFVGFDGIGGDTSEYGAAKLTGLAIDTDGAVATLAVDVDGDELPFGITIGLPEALAILYSSMPDSRRPGTVGTWANTLQAVGVTVERILITRLVGTTYYARIVLAGPAGLHRSVDARPSDCIALALRQKSPIFVGVPLIPPSLLLHPSSVSLGVHLFVVPMVLCFRLHL
eukprot:jgi/Botrbrau1/13881/Bobra.0056s0112.2